MILNSFYIAFIVLLLVNLPENLATDNENQVLVPIDVFDRRDCSLIQLTAIGDFGITRKERTGIPEHLHTGIDIMRPRDLSRSADIFPAANGVVISKRTDGPFAQLIIEHKVGVQYYWTLYEHISEIRVNVHEKVNKNDPIARFFSERELDLYGHQFDHFHFEVLKQPPVQIRPTTNLPERHFIAPTLKCFTEGQLRTRYFDPIEFLINFPQILH